MSDEGFNLGGGEGEGPIGPGGGPPEIPGGGDGESAGAESGGGARAAADLEWRRRARDAESRLERLEKELGEARASLDTAQTELAASERRRAIDAALIEADVIDVDTARLLVERSMEVSESADAAAAVSEIRREKPFLFHAGTSAGDGPGFGAPLAMEPADPGIGLAQLAEQARMSGDRQLLLRYLRARRV